MGVHGGYGIGTEVFETAAGGGGRDAFFQYLIRCLCDGVPAGSVGDCDSGAGGDVDGAESIR
jgi:hypothetical protein